MAGIKNIRLTQYLFPTSSRLNPDLEEALLAEEPTQQSIQNDLIIVFIPPAEFILEIKIFYLKTLTQQDRLLLTSIQNHTHDLLHDQIPSPIYGGRETIMTL